MPKTATTETKQIACHLDGCTKNSDMQIRAKKPSGDIVIPLCNECAQEIMKDQKKFQMYDDAKISIDLKKSITTVASGFWRFRRLK